jgi:hypothetical protein
LLKSSSLLRPKSGARKHDVKPETLKKRLLDFADQFLQVQGGQLYCGACCTNVGSSKSDARQHCKTMFSLIAVNVIDYHFHYCSKWNHANRRTLALMFRRSCCFQLKSIQVILNLQLCSKRPHQSTLSGCLGFVCTLPAQYSWIGKLLGLVSGPIEGIQHCVARHTR